MPTQDQVDRRSSARSIELVRRFIEEHLGPDLDADRPETSQPLPETDWEAIWSSGDAAETLAESIGRVLLAASEAVSSAVPPQAGRVPDARRPDVAQAAPVEPQTAPAEAPGSPVGASGDLAVGTPVGSMAATAVAPVEAPVPVETPSVPEEALPPPGGLVAPVETPPVPEETRQAGGKRRLRRAKRLEAPVEMPSVPEEALPPPWGAVAPVESAASVETQLAPMEPQTAPAEAPGSPVGASGDMAVGTPVGSMAATAVAPVEAPVPVETPSVPEEALLPPGGLVAPVETPPVREETRRAGGKRRLRSARRLAAPVESPAVVVDVSAADMTLESQVAPAQTVRAPSSRARFAYRAFGWVRAIGLIVILFAVWQLWGTAIAEHHAQSSLRTQFEAKVRAVSARSHQAGPVTAPSHQASLISASAKVAAPSEGSVVGRLQIPAIGVNQFVVEGTADQDLAKGPGHYSGTAMPGQAGNVAIAGHRTTFGAPFSHLNNVAPGDTIVLTTDSGEQLTYVVQRKPVAVSPKDISVLNYFGDNRITLTTCNPEFSASQRLVVVGFLQGAVNQTAPSPPPARVVERKVTTGFSGWRWSYLPECVVLVALLVMLALGYEKITARLGKLGRWLFLVPVWVAGLYLLFTALAGLLPASV